MRKFRAWEPETKDMVYFDLVKASKDHFIASYICLLLADEHPAGSGLMQEFTGFQDEDGVDIYVGDIIQVSELGSTKIKRACYEVRFEMGMYLFREHTPLYMKAHFDCLVVGHKFDEVERSL